MLKQPTNTLGHTCRESKADTCCSFCLSVLNHQSSCQLWQCLHFCHPGTQISCFAPTNFTLRQAVYMDSFCWATVQQQSDSSPLWLHKVRTHALCVVLSKLDFCLLSLSQPSLFSLSSLSSFHTSCSCWPSSCISRPCSGVSLQLLISPLTSTSLWRSWTAFIIAPSNWPRI